MVAGDKSIEMFSQSSVAKKIQTFFEYADLCDPLSIYNLIDKISLTMFFISLLRAILKQASSHLI